MSAQDFDENVVCHLRGRPQSFGMPVLRRAFCLEASISIDNAKRRASGVSVLCNALVIAWAKS